MNPRQRAIYACDIGSCRKGNFAWARIGPELAELVVSSSDIEALISSLERDLAAELRIALGFEAPLFVPVPDDPSEIGLARNGEGNRPFSAGAGASAALVGLQQIAWIMRRLRHHSSNHRITTDWQSWPGASATILLWEAFVAGAAKGECHADDAITAAHEFERRESRAPDMPPEFPRFSVFQRTWVRTENCPLFGLSDRGNLHATRSRCA